MIKKRNKLAKALEKREITMYREKRKILLNLIEEVNKAESIEEKKKAFIDSGIELEKVAVKFLDVITLDKTIVLNNSFSNFALPYY